jgi:hypothetical protein
MYGANPPVIGTAAGGVLAATGADPIWPLMLVAVCMVAGTLLLVRDAHLRRVAERTARA